MTTTPTALDTYLLRLPMILDKIEALRQLADNHFGHPRTPSTGATSATSGGWIEPADGGHVLTDAGYAPSSLLAKTDCISRRPSAIR